ncbi:MAG: fasciclin domain-containing protein [Acidobacteria bacterium]|nr:fasciclin domain-containing protein [Acidobacteriota bacterium]MBK9528174.1 fasciclin domain-containing protein [Acidobacteriota bacterium]MBP7474797.1 fasciclin domain-containing protein [Pyrinomonadaceae bacterium]MBP9108373.1 fasciclin domain-containing protein [Pyrinomonadaceae bacterium]
MKSFFGLVVLALSIAVGSSSVSAQDKTIVDIAVGSPDHTTLVAAVKAADLVGTLQSAGPFTVFAPVNGAFDKLPAGTVATLLKPENKSMLAKILTYHVVAGNLDSKAVVAAIKKGNGKVELTTVSGGKLWAMMDGKNVVLKDEKGGKSTITAVDLKGSNGVIHVIDSVVLPN